MHLFQLLKSFFPKRYEMNLEEVALQAVKVKIQEIFDTVQVSTFMEGKDIVIRISLPSEIMNVDNPNVGYNTDGIPVVKNNPNSNLDSQAQSAANELLGHNPQENA